MFAVLSIYWVAGGTAGIGTLALSIQESARERDSAFILGVWVTVLLKLIAGLIALAQIRAWGARIPVGIRRVGVWGTGIILVLYGSSNLVQDILIEAGIIAVPKSLGADAVRWYLFLWEPWWVLGGILFLATAWTTRHRYETQRVRPRLAHTRRRAVED